MPYLLDNQLSNFRDHPLLFIDLEFTGLDPRVHEIIEVAALLVSQTDFAVKNSYYTKVFPVHVETSNPQSLRISRYSPDDWRDAIPLRQMLTELSLFAPNCILAGWGVQNEWDFLNAALEKESLPYFYSHHLLEVYSLAYVRLFRNSDITHVNLSTAARAFGLHLDLHKPDSDIRVTYEIFRQISGL